MEQKSYEYRVALRVVMVLQDGLFVVKESEAILDKLARMEKEQEVPSPAAQNEMTAPESLPSP